jgi:hypothetical protein
LVKDWRRRKMTSSTILAVAILAVSSLLIAPVDRVYAVTGLPMVGSQWTVNELYGDEVTSTHAITTSTGVQFPFPFAGTYAGVADYALLMTDSFSASLTSSNTLTAKIIVTTSTSTTTFFGNPDGGCYQVPPSSPSTCPGAVRLYFEANLPVAGNPSSCVPRANGDNFWWSNNGVQAIGTIPGGYYQFTPGGSGGTITLSVPLDGSMWSNLCGQSGAATSDASGFAQAIQNIKYIGLSFGSGYFFENGVGVDHGSDFSGSATFELTSYTIGP